MSAGGYRWPGLADFGVFAEIPFAPEADVPDKVANDPTRTLAAVL